MEIGNETVRWSWFGLAHLVTINVIQGIWPKSTETSTSTKKKKCETVCTCRLGCFGDRFGRILDVFRGPVFGTRRGGGGWISVAAIGVFIVWPFHCTPRITPCKITNSYSLRAR